MDHEVQWRDARHIAKALISRGIDAGDPLQVIKMTYLCHGWMRGLYHLPISKQPVEAWRYGPVIPVVYHGVKRYGRAPVRSLIRGPLFPRAAVDFTPEKMIWSTRSSTYTAASAELNSP